MKIALLYSSKTGMEASLGKRHGNEKRDEEDEPPPDLLAECDSDETILAIQQALQERYQVFPIEVRRQGLHAPQAAETPSRLQLRRARLRPEPRVPHPDDLRDAGDPLHGLRSADPRRLPRQVADQGDPLLPPDPEPRVLDRRVRRGHAARHPPPGHRQAAVRGVEQGHQEQLRRPDAGRALRARRGGRPALRPAGHRRAVHRRPRVHRRRPGQLSRTSRSCPSSRSITPSSRRERRPSIPTRPSGSGTRRPIRSRSSTARRTSRRSSGSASSTS